MKEIDCKAIHEILKLFIQTTLEKSGFTRSVIGISGGLDSAVVLNLLVTALGAGNVFALLMPYRLSDPANLQDAEKLCDQARVSRETIDISPSVDSYFKRHPTDNPVLIGNKCARERMSVLYDFSERKKALVAGTSNKSELLIGYFTLYGDSAAAFLPLGDLYKTQVRKLARYLKIPGAIIDKSPSADLWKEQTDEKEIGLSYPVLDGILYLLVEERLSIREIADQGYSLPDIRKVRQLIIQSQFKRTLPPIPKLSSRTVGMDFRYLRDWNG